MVSEMAIRSKQTAPKQSHSDQARSQRHTLGRGFCGVSVGSEEKCTCPAKNKQML